MHKCRLFELVQALSSLLCENVVLVGLIAPNLARRLDLEALRCSTFCLNFVAHDYLHITSWDRPSLHALPESKNRFENRRCITFIWGVQ
jgi:hypothetical protein